MGEDEGDPFLRFERRRARAAQGGLPGLRGGAGLRDPLGLRSPVGRMRRPQLGLPRLRTEAAAAPAEESAETALLSDIGVQLVDASGTPIAREPYRIVLSDGREESGELDARGLVRFDGLPRGICRVSFPELHRNPRLRRSA